jgi:hypothetical protein
MLVALATLPSFGALACQAGELDDRQERYLRKQLDKNYPNTGGAITDQTSTDSTNQEPPGETSEPVETTSAPAPTSEPDATSAPAATSSEANTSSPAGNQVPECALEIFHTTCAGSVCHYQGAVNLPPNFETTDDVFTMLTTSPTRCDDAVSPLLVDVANPEDSYLLVKIRGQQPAGCGTPMPPDQSTITQAQIDCLEDWIGSL